MKITKKQLRRIIREEKARLEEYGGRPYDPTVPGDYERYRDNPTGDAPIGGVQDDGGFDPVDDYVAWAEENGHITPSASSVVASYIVEDPKREAYKVMIADAFGLRVSDISHEIKVQQAERAVMMGESKIKITKKQLRRIIKEEKSRLLESIVPFESLATRKFAMAIMGNALKEYGSYYGDNPKRGLTKNQQAWFDVGYEAGSHGGAGYDTMPEDENYEWWSMGFNHAKSEGGSW